MIFSPGHLTQRGQFYYQLNQLTTAGLGLVQGLQTIRDDPPANSYRKPLERVVKQVEHGTTLAQALRSAGNWLPDFDVTLIETGEQSGKLDQSFRMLAEYYTERARTLKQLIADLAYPAFLFHFAVFIFPFPKLFLTGNWSAYLSQTLGILIPIYIFLGLLVYAMQSRHGESWRAAVESALHPVPGLGVARRDLALSRLAAALEALLSAGVTIVEAWTQAAAASGSPALRRTVLAWKPLLNAGKTPAETMKASSGFPQLFSTQYSTGEISGTLDDSLRRLHQYYQEEGSRKLRLVTKTVSIGIYLAIVVAIAYKIISFYMGYFQQIQNVTS